MGKQMTPAAKIYMQEAAILEEAREQLARELDELWRNVREEAEPQLNEIANSYGRVVRVWENDSERGKYMLSPRPKGARMSMNEFKKGDGKGGSRPKIHISDPRASETSGNYEIRLRLAKNAQAKIKRNLPSAPKKMDQLFRESELKGSVKWGQGILWATTISINPDDLDETASQIVDTVHQLFRVVTEFEKWQESGRKR
jgi:hypothetical protein